MDTLKQAFQERKRLQAQNDRAFDYFTYAIEQKDVNAINKAYAMFNVNVMDSEDSSYLLEIILDMPASLFEQTNILD